MFALSVLLKNELVDKPKGGAQCCARATFSSCSSQDAGRASVRTRLTRLGSDSTTEPDRVIVPVAPPLDAPRHPTPLRTIALAPPDSQNTRPAHPPARHVDPVDHAHAERGSPRQAARRLRELGRREPERGGPAQAQRRAWTLDRQGARHGEGRAKNCGWMGPRQGEQLSWSTSGDVGRARAASCWGAARRGESYRVPLYCGGLYGFSNKPKLERWNSIGVARWRSA